MRLAQVAMKKQTAKAEKRKEATASRSSPSICSFTTSSSEEHEPPEKSIGTKKGIQATKKAPVKVPSKKQSAGKAGGKRSLEHAA